MKKTSCIVCEGTQLECGFIPDSGHGGVNSIMAFHRGEPEDVKIFGLKTGSVTSYSKREPIVAFKCKDCGFLHLFAEQSKEDN